MISRGPLRSEETTLKTLDTQLNMKFLSSSASFFLFFIIEVVQPTAGAQQRKDRWSVRRPFQVITSKLSRRPILSSSTSSGQRHPQLKYVNLSEQKGPRVIYSNAEYLTTRSIHPAALLENIYKSTTSASHRHRDGSGRIEDFESNSSVQQQQLFIDEEEKTGQGAWEGPEVKKSNNAGEASVHSRHSSIIATAVAPNINHAYSRVPSVALYEDPIFEQDSYLEALQLSRLPCQLLKDPDNCFDSTQLFRQRQRDEAPASKKLLATIRILINFHEKYPHLNTFI